jgi:hypothetical protein
MAFLLNFLIELHRRLGFLAPPFLDWQMYGLLVKVSFEFT